MVSSIPIDESDACLICTSPLSAVRVYLHSFFIVLPHWTTKAILETGCLRAPRPLAHGTLPLGGSFLLMEHLPFIPFGQSIPEVLKHLAEGLAEMHLRDPPPDVTGIIALTRMFARFCVWVFFFQGRVLNGGWVSGSVSSGLLK